MSPVHEKVKSAKHLRELTTGEHMEFKVLLNFGCFSKKTIRYIEDEGKFHIYNHIDDTEQMLGPRQIFNSKYTSIGEAIKKGSFVYEMNGEAKDGK